MATHAMVILDAYAEAAPPGVRLDPKRAALALEASEEAHRQAAEAARAEADAVEEGASDETETSKEPSVPALSPVFTPVLPDDPPPTGAPDLLREIWGRGAVEQAARGLKAGVLFADGVTLVDPGPPLLEAAREGRDPSALARAEAALSLLAALRPLVAAGLARIAPAPELSADPSTEARLRAALVVDAIAAGRRPSARRGEARAATISTIARLDAFAAAHPGAHPAVTAPDLAAAWMDRLWALERVDLAAAVSAHGPWGQGPYPPEFFEEHRQGAAAGGLDGLSPPGCGPFGHAAAVGPLTTVALDRLPLTEAIALRLGDETLAAWRAAQSAAIAEARSAGADDRRPEAALCPETRAALEAVAAMAPTTLARGARAEAFAGGTGYGAAIGVFGAPPPEALAFVRLDSGAGAP